MSTKVYRDQEREINKELSKNNIIEVSKELFLNRGFGQTNMADIAEIAKISRKTLYRYFSSKEEIAMDIELDVFKTFVGVQDEIVQSLSGNGYEKLSQYLEKLDALVDDLSQLIRLTGMFDYYLVNDYPSESSQSEFIQLIEKVDEPFIQFISEGVNDGSIHTEFDVPYLARTISNSFLSLAQRVVTRENHLNVELNIESRKILAVQRTLFLKALKA